MTSGFIDMATINSALAAVRTGKSRSLSTWHNQNLLELTHLLLQANISVVPGIGRSSGASGSYSHLVEFFPGLEFQTVHVEKARSRTKSWLGIHFSTLEKAWERAQHDPEFWAWANSERED